MQKLKKISLFEVILVVDDTTADHKIAFFAKNIKLIMSNISTKTIDAFDEIKAIDIIDTQP